MDTQVEQELANMDAVIKDAKKAIHIGAALKRLEKHDDFQLIFGQQLMSEDVVATVAKLALPACQNEQVQSSLMHKIRAASEVGYFLQMIAAKAAEAKDVVLKTEYDREDLVYQDSLDQGEN